MAGRDEGERRVVAHPSGLLSDDWTLISGYGALVERWTRSWWGRAVRAPETKCLNGTVFAREDTWELDKYDNYGNRVETGRPIEDREPVRPDRYGRDASQPASVRRLP